MTSQWETKKIKVKDEGFTETIANAVYKYLTALVDDRSNRQTRWIWELLQNAHDASTASNNRLIASIRDNTKELVFLHNGSGFTMEQIQRLVFHGSTKVEDEETIGRYGSGFLTTHLLSWDIDVSGLLDNGEWFDFCLSRNPKSVEALRVSMDKAWNDDFHPVPLLRQPMPERFTTRFKYPIPEGWAKNAVKEGITTLKQCAPFVVVFNNAFYSIDIDIKDPRETRLFKVVQRRLSVKSGLREIKVIQSINENQTEMKYLLAQGKKASVTVQVKSISDPPECLPIENIPRLFVAFPLMGTESFSFPAVINGNRTFFKPNESRDGVDLGQGHESDSDTNRNNQAVITEACELLVSLIKNAASKGWSCVHQWTKIPSTEKLVDQSWFRDEIKEELIEEIRKTPVVLTRSGKPIETKASRIPVAGSSEDVERLWELSTDLKEYREKLPRQDEVMGWCNAFKSWANVYDKNEKDISKLFPEVIDARDLARSIEDCACLKDLQELLQENVSAIKWLDRLYRFLKDNGLFNDEIRNLYIFPNQDGEFCQLLDLHRDKNIDEELKDIDKLFGRNTREKLRHHALNSLEDERRTKDWDTEHVLDELIDRLQSRAVSAEKNSDDKFKKATTWLFAWIVRQDREEYWEYIQKVPVFTEDGESHHSLRNASPNSIPPFAPVCAWQKDLQEFSDIFPKNRILASKFFEVLPNSDDWQRLNERGVIRMDKDEDIITYEEEKKVNFKDFCPKDDDKLDQQEDSEHKTANCIVVTNVKELSSIMAPLRDNPEHAVKFWRFLTEWLIKKDTHGFKEETLECESCTTTHGKIITHKCYRAAWLKPIRDNLWIRRASPSPKSLANLLRGNESAIRDLSQNPNIDKLLDAIGMSPSDLRLALIAEDPVKRDAAVNFATEVYDMPKDEMDLAYKVVQHIKAGDKSILKDFEKNEDKRRTINENRCVGKQVEEFVKQILTEKFPNKKFDVKPVHEGADIEIIELEVTQGNKKLWIEVKSTRNEGDSQEVKMSSSQAKKAVKEKKNFLLCVVPIPDSTEIDIKTVRENMRFIANIGDEVASLCEGLDWLEEVRVDITADTASGVRLDVEKSKAGILVKQSVWKKHGFPLRKLVEHLMITNNDLIT